MLIDCRSFRVARHTDGGMTISGENDEGSASLYFSPDKVAMLLDAAQPPPLFATAEDINQTALKSMDWRQFRTFETCS